MIKRIKREVQYTIKFNYMDNILNLCKKLFKELFGGSTLGPYGFMYIGTSNAHGLLLIISNIFFN